MRKQAPKLNARIVQYNNKSRQGTYIRIQEGKKRGIYKIEDDTPIDTYLLYFKDKTKSKAKGSLKDYIHTWQGQKKHKKIGQQRDRYLKTLQKKGTIGDQLGRGTTTIQVKNIHSKNTYELKEENKKLLKSLVYKPEVLDILATEENLKKMKHRLTYKIQYLDLEGRVIANSETSNKTPQELQSEENKIIRDFADLATQYTQFKKALELNEHHHISVLEKGVIKNTMTSITFKKAK